MREILPGIGNLGQLFWLSSNPPSQYAAAAAAHNVTVLNRMDAETQQDLAVLSSKMKPMPCVSFVHTAFEHCSCIEPP